MQGEIAMKLYQYVSLCDCELCMAYEEYAR